MNLLIGKHKIKGIRGNCVTGEEKEVELSYRLDAGALYRLWFHIEHGVTGYESFEFSRDSMEQLGATGWSACAGTEGRWDSLFIPAEEMAKAIKDITSQYTGGIK